MKKYDIKICRCGRIHAIPYSTVEETCYTNGKNNKDLALICGRCGNITIHGADYTFNYDPDSNEMIYDCYSYCFNNDSVKEISADAFKKPTVVIHSKGYGVPMMTGEYANVYNGRMFEDMIYPDFMEIEKSSTTMDDVRQWLATYRKNQKTVNMDRFIYELPEDVAEELSHYLIDGLDWTGTKYEHKF